MKRFIVILGLLALSTPAVAGGLSSGTKKVNLAPALQ